MRLAIELYRGPGRSVRLTGKCACVFKREGACVFKRVYFVKLYSSRTPMSNRRPLLKAKIETSRSTLEAFQKPHKFRAAQYVSRDQRRYKATAAGCSADLLILTNLTAGYRLGWESWRALTTSGGVPATSLGWQHLTADRAKAASNSSSQLRERSRAMNNLTELHEALAKVVSADRELSDTLTEITRIARRAMPSVEAASITLIRGEKPFTAAYDGQMALDADELQYERGYGPCMDAGRAGQMLLVDDMRSDQRWPDYAQHAAAHGVLSSLSVPLPFQGATIGALNTYAGRPKAFGEQDVVLAQEVAGWVALATGSAEAATRSSDDLDHLRTAMMSRAFIDQAKGILMERHKVTEDEAFTILARASQRTNTKLRDVAAELVRTGALRSRGSSFLSD
jgi:GAF domain-containing protein